MIETAWTRSRPEFGREAQALPEAAMPGLLADERFCALLFALSDRGMTFERFSRLPMPQGLTPEQAWQVLAAIRRHQAVYYRDTCLIGGVQMQQWFTPTRSIDAMLHDLGARTQASSILDTALHERHGRRFIMHSLIEETSAALACDGFAVDYETVRAIVAGDAAPTTPVGRLIANTHALLSDVVDSDDGQTPIDPAYIRHIYARLTEGIDASSIGGGLAWGMEWPEDDLPADLVLREVAAMASGELADPAAHPIIMGQQLTCKIWKYPPFPSCNYILGSLVTRLYMKRKGYPVFTYIPSSKMTLAWKSGGYTDERVSPYAQCGAVTGFDRDWTVYWESCLALLQHELDRLERYVLELKTYDDVLLASLESDHAFNHRQRDVLRRAVLTPGLTVRIEEHRRAYELAYSTARADLTALVERGLLEMHYEGKAQVFGPRRDMKAVLGRRYAQ